MTPPGSDEDEPIGLAATPEAVYWKLRGHLQVLFERHIGKLLEQTEKRICERIDKSDANADRGEQRHALAHADFERRIRVLEASTPDRLGERLRGTEELAVQARLTGRMLTILVPLGFTAIAVLIALLQYMRRS